MFSTTRFLLHSAINGMFGILLAFGMGASIAQDALQLQPKPRNAASQRYEINQTFDGQPFRKDNNVWVYTKEFADLFGMPAAYIEDVQGVAAAAFRIESRSYQDCGFGGQSNACVPVEDCLLDLYFDESKAALPWVTEIKSQWLPRYSSMIWLRPSDPKERPHGTLAIDPPPGIIRNETLHGQIIPLADPVSKREAIFLSNVRTDQGGEDETSGALALLGYTRDFYQKLSVVSLQLGCSGPVRPVVAIRLESKRSVYDPPIARFNKVILPKDFVRRIVEARKNQSERNSVFYRSLFAPPLGTKGTADSPSSK